MASLGNKYTNTATLIMFYVARGALILILVSISTTVHNNMQSRSTDNIGIVISTNISNICY